MDCVDPAAMILSSWIKTHPSSMVPNCPNRFANCGPPERVKSCDAECISIDPVILLVSAIIQEGLDILLYN
jgi:hypothetical protein